MSDTTTVPASGDDGIDGLLSGHRWVGPAVRFGFPGSATEHGGAPETYPELAGFVAPTEAMRAVARHAFASVEALVADIALVEEAEAPGDAPVRIGTSTTMRGSSPAYAAYPREERGGDAWFRPGSYDDPRPGDNAWRALFHEIGHTMGLKHGHAYDPRFLDLIDAVLPAGRDSHEFSLMTYRSHIGHPTLYGYTNAADSHPQSYMMLDIAALQYLYGADYGTNAGDTVYAFSPETGAMLVDGTAEEPPPVANILFRTVWDGGGFDAYDFSLYGARRELGIDLRPGLWTDVDADSAFQAADLGGGPEGGRARGQVFNALLHEGDPRSLIEKAIGGRGDDTITGNEAGNVLIGGAGDDVLDGGAGDDLLEQGPGGGAAMGGGGRDTLAGGPGDDVLDGGGGADLLLGSAGADTLAGGAGADLFRCGRPGQGGDAIADFAPGTDRIEVSAAGFRRGLEPGMDLAAEGRLVEGTEATAARGQFLHDAASGALRWHPDGTGAGPAVPIAALGAGVALGAGDLVVVA